MTTLARFCLVGASGYLVNLVNLVVFAGMTLPGAGHALAAAVAFAVAVATNFRLNRRFTFEARGSAWRFASVSMVAFAASLAALELLVATGLPLLGAQAASLVAVTPLSFLGNRAWSFRA